MMPSKNDRLLLEAVLANDYKETEFLLSIGANPNHLFEAEGGISAFHIAVGADSTELTRIFLNSEADVNLKCNRLGWTPMHVCAYWNKPEQLKLLLAERDADPFKLSNSQNTVLETAIQADSKQCINIIEEYFRQCNQAQLTKKRFTINQQQSPEIDADAGAETLLLDSSSSLSDISILNTKNPADFTNLITTTFNESTYTEYLPNDLLPALSGASKRTSPHEYMNIRQVQNKTILISSSNDDNDEQDCFVPQIPRIPRKSRRNEVNNYTPEKYVDMKNRFQSPPSFPPFYTEHLPKKSIETQTTSQCVVMKRKDLKAKSKSPVNNEGFSDEVNNQNNVLSSVKKWLLNKFTSPSFLNRTQCHDFQTELAQTHKNTYRESYESQQLRKPTSKHQSAISLRQPRAASASAPVTRSQNGNQSPVNGKIKHRRDSSWNKRVNTCHDKPQAPIAPPLCSQESSFIDLNDIITDNIGSQFFKNVLGKSDSVQSMSKIIQQRAAKKSLTPKKSLAPQKPPTTGTPTNRQNYYNKPSNNNTPINHNTQNQQPGQTNLTKKTNSPSTHTPKILVSPSPSQFFRHSYHSMSTNSATLTPTRYEIELNNTIEDPFIKYNDTIITLDNSTDDLDTSGRKSTSTKIGHEVIVQTSFDVDDVSILADQFNDQIQIQESNVIKREPMRPIDKNLHKQKNTKRASKCSKETKETGIAMTGYSTELLLQLENRLNLTTTSDIMVSNMFECFGESPANTNQSDWREGHIKSAFNYVLIDPRVSQDLPSRAKKGMEQSEVLKAFCDSIFYIGKGSRARPYAHLHDTVRVWKSNGQVMSPSEKMPKKSKKISRIIDIWEENLGVVSLHIFQSVIPCEAYTREAAMIDAIGIHNLTNVKKGNYYGSAKNWKHEYKCKLGAILLKKACAILLAEGERQIKPEDI